MSSRQGNTIETEQRSESDLQAAGSQPADWRRFLMPSMGDVIFITLFSLALALGANLTQRDGDFAKHLQLGQSVIENGQLPTTDIYSHTMAGGEMVPHEWLAQTALAATERWFGFDGIGLLTAVLSALPWMIMYRWLVKRGKPVALAVALTFLGAAASMIHWASRPHIFTWLFMVIWVILLEDLRKGHRNQVWVLVPLTVLWANTHGAFILGFALVGTYLMGDLIDRYRGAARGSLNQRARHLSMVLAGTVAASLVSPSGVGTLIHPFAHLGDDFLFDFTREFNSPDFHSPLIWPFLIMIVLSVLLSFRWTPTTLLLASFWTISGLYAFRNIPLYALVMTPILAEALRFLWPPGGESRLPGRLREYSRMERLALGGALSAFIIVVSAFSLARLPGSGFDFNPGFFPVEAVNAVGESPPGERVFNQFVWGGYLVYCCHPEITVFIDGQTDYYGPDITRQYDQTIRGMPAWRDVFDQHDVDWVLISPNTGLAQVLSEADDWVETYRDNTAVAFVPAP